MKISVCLSTRRYGGLLQQLEFFRYQTFPKQDFEIVIIDGLYWQRTQSVIEKAKEWGLNIVYDAPRKLNWKVSIDHSSTRNDALALANGELIVFFDDYQIPVEHLLEEHWKIYQQGYCCQGRQHYFEATDFDNVKDIKLKKSGNPDLGSVEREMPPTTFYTHNCSAPLAELIKVNGFDERFNSANGGEDYECGSRLSRIGNKMKYNPKALCYHMSHEAIRIYPADPTICSFIYDAKTKETFLELYPTISENEIEWIDWVNIEKYNGKNHDISPIYCHPNFTG